MPFLQDPSRGTLSYTASTNEVSGTLGDRHMTIAAAPPPPAYYDMADPVCRDGRQVTMTSQGEAIVVAIQRPPASRPPARKPEPQPESQPVEAQPRARPRASVRAYSGAPIAVPGI